jgi:hypothetical protein
MRLLLTFLTASFVVMFAGPSFAACAVFVCNHPTCRYRIESSRGSLVINLGGGERRLVHGLAGDAAYCDWSGGCTTQLRPVRSLGSC